MTIDPSLDELIERCEPLPCHRFSVGQPNIFGSSICLCGWWEEQHL